MNIKKLANHVDDLKIFLVLQNEMLLVMLFCKHFFKQREDIPRYGKTINNSFLGTVCYTIFGASCSFKNMLIQLSTKVVDLLTHSLLLHETQKNLKLLKILEKAM